MDWFDQGGSIDDYPVVALVSAFALTMIGEAERATRLASTIDGPLRGELLADGVTPVEAFAALFRTITCREGVKRMSLDAALALDLTPEASPFRSNALVLSGAAKLMAGDDSAADADFADAAEVGAVWVLQRPCPPRWPSGRSSRSRGATGSRPRRSQIKLVRKCGSAASTTTRRVPSSPQCRPGWHFTADNRRQASNALVRTQRLRPQLTYAIPWLSVQVRLELAHAYLTLADPAGARTVLREIDGILRHRPDLGVLVTRVDEVKAMVEGMRMAAPGMSTLTAAELRVLPFLATHLTLPEIGERLFLSRHTIKSQAISTYRKLGVSTRNEAVARVTRSRPARAIDPSRIRLHADRVMRTSPIRVEVSHGPSAPCERVNLCVGT